MKLSVIIPCYNESKTILSLINAVKKSPVIEKEIIIVDDGSKAGTRDILNKMPVHDVEVQPVCASSDRSRAFFRNAGKICS